MHLQKPHIDGSCQQATLVAYPNISHSWTMADDDGFCFVSKKKAAKRNIKSFPNVCGELPRNPLRPDIADQSDAKLVKGRIEEIS